MPTPRSSRRWPATSPRLRRDQRPAFASSCKRPSAHTMLQVAQVSDSKTQVKITLLANLVAGTVQAIAAVIPSCQANAQASFKALPPYSVSSFADQYNSILVAPTGNAAVDAATLKLKLHGHSKLVRALTFGRLQ